MGDEVRATGGLDSAHDRRPPRRSPWGRRSPYGSGYRDGPPGGGRGRPMPRSISAPTIAACWSRARPAIRFRVIDAFSRIIRLGEGISASGRISDAAIERAVEALAHLPRQDANRGVTRARLIATEACRAAVNGGDFRARVARGGRARSRDHRPRDRGRAGRHRLHAAGRSRRRRRDPVRHRRRLVRAGAARPLGAVPARAAAAGDQGVGVDAGRRRDAGRAPRRA